MKLVYWRYILTQRKTINVNIMKIIFATLLSISVISFLSGCNPKGSAKKELQAATDSVTVPDTGYTGIKQYMSGKTLIKEVTFKNGVREGLMKAFYQTGEVRQTFWYEKGLREDSSMWYYMEGQVFRATPYKRDTIDGIQKQYYRTGRLKAKLGYSKGFRTTFLEEYTPDGKLVSGYPEVVFKITDEYQKKGIVRVVLELSNQSTNVRYWRGELSKGVFDTVQCKRIQMVKGVCSIDLKKTGTSQPSNLGIIAEILTNFGNNYLVYKKIDLPYNDLK